MYNNFFGFKEKPFKLVPNPDYLFLSKSHEVALAHLSYATDQGDGFVVITGEVGTGKTTMCRIFLERLGQEAESAYIFNPKLDSVQLLTAICNEFGMRTNMLTVKELLDVINGYLILKNRAGRKVILLIDEAQNLTVENLEMIRMLSNLETTRSKLLQIILVGQPELGDKLDAHELRQLAQRISMSCHLTPLSARETEGYILHRINIAAQRRADIFTPGACRVIYKFSNGIPRLINVACDRALLAAYSLNRTKVTAAITQKAISELASHRGSSPRRFAWGDWATRANILAVLLVVCGGSLGWFFFHNFRSSSTQAQPAYQNTHQNTNTYQNTYKIPDESEQAAALDRPEAGAPPAAEVAGMRPPAPAPAPMRPAAPHDPASIPTGPTRPELSASTIEAAAETSTPAASTQPGEPATNPRAFNSILEQLNQGQSRRYAVETMLMLWQQPQPNTSFIPATLLDRNFFEFAARQYGLRLFSMTNNWSLLKQLNLPAIIAFKKDYSSETVYMALVSWRDDLLWFRNGHGPLISVEFETVKPYLQGEAHLLWKNVFEVDFAFSKGASHSAIVMLKSLLGKMGYRELGQNPEFDEATEQALIDFQSKNNLVRDGIVGPLTKIVLIKQAEACNNPTLNSEKWAGL